VLCGEENLVGLKFKDVSVFTTAAVTRSKMRHANFFLCNEDSNPLCWPSFKGATKSLWPNLESCMLPHPGKFVLPNVSHQHLTRLVLSAPGKISCLPSYKTLQVVVLMCVRMVYFPDGFDLTDYRNVPHLVIAHSNLEFTCYLCNLGHVSVAPEGEVHPPSPVWEMWKRDDIKLKRISFYRCFTQSEELTNSQYTSLMNLDSKQIELFEATQSQYKKGTKVHMSNRNQVAYQWSAQHVHFLRTCVSTVTHALLNDPREMRALLAGFPVHPDMERLDHAPDIIDELGRCLASNVVNAFSFYDSKQESRNEIVVFLTTLFAS
jgi:hypothetical protein